MQTIEKQTIEAFEISGQQVTTSNEHEFNAETAKLPALWQNFEIERQNKLALNETTAPIFAIYSAYSSDLDGDYQVTVGMRPAHGDLLHNSLRVTIDAGDYLVFKNRGKMPQAVIETWQRVWAFFEGDKDYQRSYKTDFERYDGIDQVSIYIGIESS